MPDEPKTGKDDEQSVSDAIASVQLIEALLRGESIDTDNAPSEISFDLPLSDVLKLIPDKYVLPEAANADPDRPVSLTVEDLFGQLKRGRVSLTVAKLAFGVPADLVSAEAFQDETTAIRLPLGKVVTALDPTRLKTRTTQTGRHYNMENLPDPFSTMRKEAVSRPAGASKPVPAQPTPVEAEVVAEEPPPTKAAEPEIEKTPEPVVAAETEKPVEAAEETPPLPPEPEIEEAPEPVVAAKEPPPLPPEPEVEEAEPETAEITPPPLPPEPEVEEAEPETVEELLATEATEELDVEEAPEPVVAAETEEPLPPEPEVEAAEPETVEELPTTETTEEPEVEEAREAVVAAEAEKPVETAEEPQVEEEHVLIAKAEEPEPETVEVPRIQEPAKAKVMPEPPAGPEPTELDRLGGVNLNTATVVELLTLDGVSKGLAETIVKHRETHGEFTNVFGLHGIGRVGRKTFKKITGMPYNSKHLHRRWRLAKLLRMPVDQVSHLPTVVEALANRAHFDGCILSDEDGFVLAESKAHDDAEKLAAIVPRIYRRIQEDVETADMQLDDLVSMSIGTRMVTVSRCHPIYLTLVHNSKKLTKSQVSLIERVAKELAWFLSHRAYVRR